MTRNKKLSLEGCWSVDKFLRSDVFEEIIARDQYFKLLAMLHFTHDFGPTNDRLHKIRNVIDMIRKTFNQSFQLYQRLCIDESLLLYKRRLSFKQYISLKKVDFGLNSLFLVIARQDLYRILLFMPGHRLRWIAKIRQLENREQ